MWSRSSNYITSAAAVHRWSPDLCSHLVCREQRNERIWAAFTFADLCSNNIAPKKALHTSPKWILSHQLQKFPTIRPCELWHTDVDLCHLNFNLTCVSNLPCAFGFARLSVWCSDTSAGTRLEQFTTDLTGACFGTGKKTGSDKHGYQMAVNL